MTHRALSALGLCRKAGKLVMGFDAVADRARLGDLHLVVLSEDLSEKSRKNLQYILDQHNIIPCAAPFEMDDVAGIVGRRCGILGVTDPNLAAAVRTALSSQP